MFEDIVAAHPDDEYLQYRYRENPRSLELEYWTNHFEMEFFKTWCPKDDVVFDYGCGSGGMTTLLYRDGYNIFGFDESKGSIEVARRVSEGQVVFHDTFPKKAVYDRVWMCHVVEHIPTEDFPKVFKQFRLTARILISVPLGYAYDDHSGHHVQHWASTEDLAKTLEPYLHVDWVSIEHEHSVLRAQVRRRRAQ